MRTITALIAATFIAAGCSLAAAQSSGSSSSSGVGGDPSTPRQNMTRPTPNSPPVNRRGDDMAPMQGSNVSNQSFNSNQMFNEPGMTKKKSKKRHSQH
jgi:hypothetical protein